MGKLLLGALVLLLSLGAACVKAAEEGEWCRAWIYYGVELFSTVFLCPQRLDGADAQFCCGTCSLPYCCSSREARLNQAQCSAGLKAKPSTVAPRTKSKTTPSRTIQDLLIVLWVILAALTFVVFGNWVCHHGAELWEWLRLHWNRLRARFRIGQWGQMVPEERCRLPRSLTFDTPSPYSYYRSEDPPPYTAVDPLVVEFCHSKAENPEDEVAILSPAPLAVRPVPVCTTLAPTLEEAVAVDPLVVEFCRSNAENPKDEVAILSPAPLAVRPVPVCTTLAPTLEEEAAVDPLVVEFCRSNAENPEDEVGILSPAPLDVRPVPVCTTIAPTLEEAAATTV